MKIEKTKLLMWFFVILFIASAGIVIKDFVFIEKEDNTITENNKNLIEEIEKLDEKQDEENNSSSNNKEDNSNLSAADKKKQNLEKLRKRYSLRWIVIKWDFYNKQNEPEKALEKYLEAHKSLPTDEKITKKIADLYFEEKDFNNAYNYYFKIKDSDVVDLDKLLLSLIYSQDLSNITSLKKLAFIIKNDIPLNKDGKFYYMNSLACISDFHQCKKNFNTYFEKNKIINYSKLEKIKDTIKQYQDFKINELYYKDTLLTAAFFDAGIYPLSAKVWEQILEKKPKYQSIMQIIWKSYFEMQEFEKAKNILEKSYELDTSNPKISYLLWIINFNLEDYQSSNLYYNAAIKSGYTPKIDLERRLAYNYFILEDKENMLSTFGYLLEEENANISDFSLWIYHALLNNKKRVALKWANLAKEKFPDEELFYGYLWWVYRELNLLEKAEETLTEWFEKNSRNPLITLNLWYLYLAKDDLDNAKKFFKRTYLINSNWEFWTLAKNEIKNIENFTNE